MPARIFFRSVAVLLHLVAVLFFAGCMKPCDCTHSQDVPEETASVEETKYTESPPPADTGTGIAAPSLEGDVTYHMDQASLLNAQIHDIAIQLIENMQGEPGTGGVVGVATFVDLNNLYRTSPFGRYLAEQLMGELQRAGFKVVEVRKTESLLIKERYGEYSLSREIREIARQTSARMILVGTYLVKGDFVFVNARLVSGNNSMVASSAMKILRRDRFMQKMLWPSSAPEKGETIRIPVKAFGEPTEVRIIQGS